MRWRRQPTTTTTNSLNLPSQSTVVVVVDVSALRVIICVLGTAYRSLQVIRMRLLRLVGLSPMRLVVVTFLVLLMDITVVVDVHSSLRSGAPRTPCLLTSLQVRMTRHRRTICRLWSCRHPLSVPQKKTSLALVVQAGSSPSGTSGRAYRRSSQARCTSSSTRRGACAGERCGH